MLVCGITAQSQLGIDSPLTFRLHVICDTVKYSACAVMDVNKDGHMDVVSGAHWYEGPSWKRHFVRDVEIIKGRPDGYSHLELDVNQDGYIDLVHVISAVNPSIGLNTRDLI